MESTNANGMRLNQYLARCGVCSRRESDKLIAAGRVSINGRAVELGQRVLDGDIVSVDSKQITLPDENTVIAYYKPVGVVCTSKDEHAKRTVADEIPEINGRKLTYAGRLDKDSEGLLIMTNDGDLINAMMRAANYHEKEYIVKVDRSIDERFLKAMGEGVYLQELDVTTRPCDVKRIGRSEFDIVLTQGYNRQIRRMCQELGYEVKALKRVRIMNVLLDGLKTGEFREITGDEKEELYQMAKR